MSGGSGQYDVAQGAFANQAAQLQHKDGEAHEQECARHPRGHRGLDVLGDRCCEIGAEQHGGDGNDPPAEPASDDERDDDAVDEYLHREGEEERHPLERVTEPRRRREDLGAENHAGDRHAVDDTSHDAEHCAKARRVVEPGASRAPEHRADQCTRAECAEKQGDPALCAHSHHRHVRK